MPKHIDYNYLSNLYEEAKNKLTEELQIISNVSLTSDL